MDPHDDGEICLNPSRIGGVGGGVGDVGKKIETTENGVKEIGPPPIAVGLHVKGERDQAFDVHAIDAG